MLFKLNNKKIRVFLLVLLLLSGLASTDTYARLVFSNEDAEQIDGALILDVQNDYNDIDLQFGQDITARIRFDRVSGNFEINENIDVEGNELINFRAENLSSAPTCNAGAAGRVYHNTTDNNSYVCDSSTWKKFDGLTDVVDDTTPQLGGNLDVNGNSIVSVSNGDIAINPDGTGDLTVNTDDLVVDTSTGRVGIGTNSPDRNFHVEVVDSGTNTVSYGQRLSHITSGTPGNNIGVGLEFEQETTADNNEILATIEAIATDITATAEDGALVFKTMDAGATAAEQMRIASDGSVGIGTSSPNSNYALDVNGKLKIGTNLQVRSDGGGNGEWAAINGMFFYPNVPINSTPAGTALLNVLTNNTIGIDTNGATSKLGINGNLSVGSNYKNTLAPTDGAIIEGNVGIGTSAPSSSLQVVGTIRSEKDNSDNPVLNSTSHEFLGKGGYWGIRQDTSNGWNLDMFNSGSEVTAIHADANGFIGIGTTSPDRLLHTEIADSGTNAVSYGQRLSHITDGTAAAGFGTGLEFELESAAGNNETVASIQAVLGDATDDAEHGELRFFTADIGDDGLAQRMVIDEDGQVGIGTTAPVTNLHLNSNNSTSYLQFSNSVTGSASVNDGTTLGMNASDAYYYNRESNGKLFFGTNDQARLTILPSGYVGIGTMSPASELHTIGDISFGGQNSSAGVESIIDGLGTGQLRIRRNGVNQWVMGEGGTTDMVFSPNGTEAIRVVGAGDDAGYVGIGTTSPNGWVTIDQGADDEAILSLQSSDVVHGVTAGYLTTNTYGNFSKYNLNSGGLWINGATESNIGLQLQGTVTSVDTTKSTTSVAPFNFRGVKKSGASWTDLGSNSNIVTIRDDGVTRFIFDAEGTMHSVGDSVSDTFGGDGATIMSGKVGIGTTSPAKQLEIFDTGDSRMQVTTSSAFGEASIDLANTGDSAGYRIVRGSTGNLRFDESLTFSAGEIGAVNTRLMIEDGGNVGIGTSAPDRLLHTEVADSGTNTVSYGQRLSHITDGTAAAGFGTGLEFELESAAGNTETVASIQAVLGDATDDAEHGELRFFTADIGDDGLAQRMVIDENGNMGIGTTSPAAKLHVEDSQNLTVRVKGSGAATYTRLNIQNDQGSDNYLDFITYGSNYASGEILGFERSNHQFLLSDGSSNTGLTMGTYTAVPLTFSTNNAERIRIDSSGNVGIGTTSPAEKFHLQGNSDLNSLLRTSNGGGNVFSTYENSADASDAWASGRTNGGNFAINHSTSSTYPSGTTNTRFAIDTAGNVGIGTAIPSYKLDVTGQLRQTNSTGIIGRYDITNPNANQVQGTWDFYTNTAVAQDFFGKFGFKFEGGTSDADKQFQVNIANASDPKMVVDGAGNMGIGTIDPDFMLHVAGTSGLGKIERANSSGNVYAPGFLFTRSRGTIASPANIEDGDWFGKVQFQAKTAGGEINTGAFAFIGEGTSGDGRFSFMDADISTERMVIKNTGEVGIGTINPQSTLHVPDGKYAQFEDNNAGAPASGDCDADTERGRISIDTSNNRFYICNGSTRGWDYIALTD